MPEGDTVRQAATRLRTALVGRTITQGEVRVPRFAAADLRGGDVTAVRSLGKHLLMDVGMPDGRQIVIHSHLKMDGRWDVHPAGTRWRRPAHRARIVLRFGPLDDLGAIEAVGFDLGILEVLEPAEADRVLASLGPDLLAEDFDLADAVTRLGRDPGRPVGDVLLDQRVLSGLGNVYRAEVCFLSGALPSRPIGTLDLPALAELSRSLIWANRDRPRRVTTGDPRRGHEMWVYGREGRPCGRCGTAIAVSWVEAERVTYWCPRCQT